jgi:Ni,Fe-hydrogenase III large subunit
MGQLYSEILKNSSTLDIREIPVLKYDDFYNEVSVSLKGEEKHCVAYYGVESGGKIKFFLCIADDKEKNFRVYSFEHGIDMHVLKSLTPVTPQLHLFEREIHENFGVHFEGHPWLKPVRYPYYRPDRSKIMDNYPFYIIDSEELHEVGVGPIHAGVIEPGYFRFICNGEKVLHLETQLGYQHRGIEKLFTDNKSPLQQCILSENIAGDSSVAYSLAHSQLVESLAGIESGYALQIERCIAIELERMAVHIGDTAALCGDVAYQLGQVVCEALRTEIINMTLRWCGNRFGKGLIRPGGSNYPMSITLVENMLKILERIEMRFTEITDRIYSMPSVLARFEDIGQVTKLQALSIGAVGMAARSCGIPRDIRISHPFQYYEKLEIRSIILETGDVLARGLLRVREVGESIRIIRDLVKIWEVDSKEIRVPQYNYKLKPNRFAISVVEGWRGEICHAAFTDVDGKIYNYKIVDPSFHNWMALALAVRNQEISDFPVCNKSFNLSYCGNDL